MCEEDSFFKLLLLMTPGVMEEFVRLWNYVKNRRRQSANQRRELPKKANKKKLKVYLYPWHFLPSHRKKTDDGSWQLLGS